MRVISTLAIALFCTTNAPVFAESRSNCSDAAKVSETLASLFGETVQEVGMDRNGNIVQIFADLNDGSWTIVLTPAGGPSCLIASGDNYFEDNPGIS